MISFQYIKPPLVLGVIATFISALLIITHNQLPDTSGIMTDKLRASCEVLMGEGREYAISTDFEAGELPRGVEKVIVDGESGEILALEVTAGGYKPPDGITMLIAFNSDGSIKALAPTRIKDDPGIGTKVGNQSFLAQFVGANSHVAEIDAVTGATYSSRGVADAVNIAIEAFAAITGTAANE